MGKAYYCIVVMGAIVERLEKIAAFASKDWLVVINLVGV